MRIDSVAVATQPDSSSLTRWSDKAAFPDIGLPTETAYIDGYEALFVVALETLSAVEFLCASLCNALSS